MASSEESLNCWRSIIHKGRVTSTYKMALGFAIARLVEEGKRQVSMEELARLFFEIYLERLKYDMPQTSNPAQLTVVEQAINKYKEGSFTEEEAIHAIEKEGFTYVLDAFHRLPEGESPIKFYHRTGLGIMLTDAAYRVFWSSEKDYVMCEMDARWSELEEGFARKSLGSNVLTWVASNKSATGADSLGWCRANASEGSITHIGDGVRDFADRIASDLSAGYKVALGFEHPLYIDVPKNPDQKAIFLEKESSVAQGPGSERRFGCLPRSTFAPGLSETAWVLEKVRIGTAREITPAFGWRRFIDAKDNLFIWEALITSDKRNWQTSTNAELAARSFLRLYPRMPVPEISEGSVPFSLAAAALMWAGFPVSRETLYSPCVTVKAS